MDEGRCRVTSLLEFNDDIIVNILKHMGSVYMIGRDYTPQTEPAGSLRIAASVNSRLRRLVHSAAAQLCFMSDAHAFEICADCPRLSSTLFQHCDEVRIGPIAAKASYEMLQGFTDVVANHFQSLKRVHVTGAELPTDLAQALTSSQYAAHACRAI